MKEKEEDEEYNGLIQEYEINYKSIRESVATNKELYQKMQQYEYDPNLSDDDGMNLFKKEQKEQRDSNIIAFFDEFGE